MSTPEVELISADEQGLSLAQASLPEQGRNYRAIARKLLGSAAALAAGAGSLFVAGGSAETAHADATSTERAPLYPGQKVELGGYNEGDVVVLHSTALFYGENADLGYGVAWTDGAAYPNSSNYNAGPEGQPVTNTEILKAGANGAVDYVSQIAPQHLILDQLLVIPAEKADLFELLETPERIFDQKNYEPGTPMKVSFGAEHANQTALVNVTVANPNKPGFFASTGSQVSSLGRASVLNSDGPTRANLSLVSLDANGDGYVMGLVSKADRLIADNMGWIKPEPVRVLDTRSEKDAELINGEEREVYVGKQYAGKYALLQVTAADAKMGKNGYGYLNVFSTITGPDETSTVNIQSEPMAGMAWVPVDNNGNVGVMLRDGGSTEVMFDVFGDLDGKALSLDGQKAKRVFDSRVGIGADMIAERQLGVVELDPMATIIVNGKTFTVARALRDTAQPGVCNLETTLKAPDGNPYQLLFHGLVAVTEGPYGISLNEPCPV
jgi:hypothetical protein